MKIYQHLRSRVFWILLLSLPSMTKDVMGQPGPTHTLTISSDPSTPSGFAWTYDNGTRTLTVNSIQTNINVNDIVGYLNTGPLTIILDIPPMSAYSDLSVLVSSAINSTGTANGLTIGRTNSGFPYNIVGLIDINAAISIKGPVTLHGTEVNLNSSITTTGSSGDINIYATDLTGTLGNVNMNVPLSASGASTIEVQGNINTKGNITNLILNGLNGNQDVDGTSVITNLTVNKAVNAAAIMKSSGMKTVTGVLTMMQGKIYVEGSPGPGFLTLRSDANGTARVAMRNVTNSEIIGSVFVERYIPAISGVTPRQKQWRSIGFPFIATDAGRISGIGISFTPGSESLMIFNESDDDKTNYGNTGIRNAGYQKLTGPRSGGYIPREKGVMAWLFGPDNSTPLTGGSLPTDLTIRSYGELNEVQTFLGQYQLTHPEITNANNGWNLISNPYASTIDWDVVADPDPSNTNLINVASTIYRWDPMAANWTTYNPTGGGTGSRYIESGSSFFIKAATPGSGGMTLRIPQWAKVANTDNRHFTKAPFRLDIPGERMRSNSPLAGLRLKASGMGNPIPGEAYLDVSRSDASRGWDPKYDGWMMSRSSGANVYFDGEQEEDLSMEFDQPLRIGEQRYYPITVTTPEPGETMIDISGEGKWSNTHSVTLIDKKAGRTILMKGDTLKYKVRLDELKAEGRFVLAINYIKPDAEGMQQGTQLKVLGNPVTGQTIDLLVSHPTASPRSWKVWDMTGREAGKGVFVTDAGIQHKLTVPGMRHPGIYIVQVEMDNGETSQVRIRRN